MNEQQVSRKHPVPQNVMDVEFKLIGSLTLRQFLFIFVAALFSFLLFKSVRPIPLNILAALLAFGSGAAIAFVPLEERGLDQWVISFITAIISPTQRVWKKMPSPPTYLLGDYADIVTSEILSLAPVKSRAKLRDYLQRVEEQEEEKDLLLEQKEEEFFKKLGLSEIDTTTSQPIPQKPSPTGKEAGRTHLLKKATGKPVLTPKPVPQMRATPEKAEIEKMVEKEINKPQLATTRIIKETPLIKIRGPERQDEFIPAIKNIEPRKLNESLLSNAPGMQGEIILPIRGEVVIEPELQKKGEKALKEEIQTTALLRDLKETIDAARDSLTSIRQQAKTGAVPTTPSQTPPPERADNLFSSPEFQRSQIQSQLRQFTTQLSGLKEEQRKGKTNLEKTITYYEQQINGLKEQLEKTQSAPDESKNVKQAEDKLSELQKQSRILQHQLESVQKTLSTLKEQTKNGQNVEKESFIQQQQILLDQLVANKQDYENKIEMIMQQLKKRVQATPQKQARTAVSKGKESGSTPFTATQPNTIYGTVRARDGHLVENAVIIIKNTDGEPIRALKTNTLGQFKTNTPMPNNTYRIEVTREGLTFNPVEVVLQGGVIGEIEIIET